jgi:murein DD-endopeptidase
MPTPLTIREALGLLEPRARLQESLIALRGADSVPPTRFGLSSLRQWRPRISLPLWRGKFLVDRKAILTNLFNHTQTPIEDGWSVRITSVRDFRGRGLTYDSHNGTDFALPIGTTVVAVAPARVVRTYTEYNRGGHKIVLDHGGGLFTSYAHLARVLVTPGDRLHRGQTMGISGYSGLDAIVSGPFGVPHVHFNTWWNAQPVDPFPYDDQPSLWVGGGNPLPPADRDASFEPTMFDPDAVDAAIDACRTAEVRERLRRLETPYERGCMLVSEWNYYPTRFPHRPPVIASLTPRSGRMSIPCPPDEIDGVVFADEM